MAGKIGVLALQGAFRKHIEMLHSLDVGALEVRTKKDLEQCIGLIIPGGESTVMTKLNDLELQNFDKPIFGTCAGMILMANLGFLDVALERNAYGRQSCSFSEEIAINLGQPHTFRAIFIRAPKIKSFSHDVQVFADQPVIVQQGMNLATSFHPELTKDPSIHHYFVQLCKKKQSQKQQ